MSSIGSDSKVSGSLGTLGISSLERIKSEYTNLNTQFGQLNPLIDSGISDVPFNKQDVVSFFNQTRRMTESAYSVDLMSNAGPFIGIVLSVHTDPNDPQITDANWITRAQKSCGTRESVLMAVRVRIPELHAHLPLPDKLTQGGNSQSHSQAISNILGGGDEDRDKKIIEMHPLFSSADTEVSAKVPQVGSLVWVDFIDTKSQTGGVYLRPVDTDKTTVNTNAAGGGGAGGFNPLDPSLGTLPAPGDTNPSGPNPNPNPSSPDTRNPGDPVPGGGYPPNGSGDYKDANMAFFGILDNSGAKRMRNKKIDMIVLHDGGRMIEGLSGILSSRWIPGNAGTHYWIDHDGEVFQLADEARKVNHAGAEAHVVKAGLAVPNINNRSIGIDLFRIGSKHRHHVFINKYKVPPEYGGTGANWSNRKKGDQYGYSADSRGYRDPYTKESMVSLKKLLLDITSRYNIPYNSTHIVPHGAVNRGDGAHSDPIYPFLWGEIDLDNKYGPTPGGKYGKFTLADTPGAIIEDPQVAEPEPPPQPEEPSEEELAASQVAEFVDSNSPTLTKQSNNFYSSKGGFFIPTRTTIGGIFSEVIDKDGNNLGEYSKILNRGVYKVKTKVTLIRDIKIKPDNLTVVGDIKTLRTNRVRVYSYGDVNMFSENLVSVPHVYGQKRQKLHILAAKRLESLNDSWLKYIKQENFDDENITGLFRIAKGAIRHKYRDNYNYYSEKMKNKYGSIEEGARLDPFHSEYETGLVFDIGNNGITYEVGESYKDSIAWNWLVQNAYLHGIYPSGQHPWKWEVQVTRQSWFTGKEFIGSKTGTIFNGKYYKYGVYVREESIKSNKLTSDVDYKYNIFE